MKCYIDIWNVSMEGITGRYHFHRAVSFSVKVENIGNLLVKQGIDISFINLGCRNVSNSICLITIKNKF